MGRFIRNMKISRKLMLTPILVTILLAIFGGISYFAFSFQKDDMGKVVKAFEDSQELSSFLQNLMTIYINLFMALSVAPDSISTAKSTFDTQTEAIRKAQEDLKKMTNQDMSKKEKELYKEAIVCFEEYRKIVEEIFNIIKNEDKAKLSDYTLKQKVDMYFVEMVNALKEVLKIKESQCKEKYTLSKIMQKKIFRISLSLFIISIFLSIFLTIGITRLTLKPISQTVETIRAISGGDLTKRIEVESKDEIGEMAQRVNDLVSRLKNVIVKLLEGSDRVTHFANLLDNVTENMARSIKDTASQLDSLAVASEEMSKTASEISKNCLNAAKSAETASISAKIGAEVIEGTLAAMDKINEIVKASSNLINNLGIRSTEIGEIVKLINDIADQTNLLALNAAIEAARAGEAGRGFAVVADEVRKLAERTTQATKEIGETIGKIQAETKQAVSSMDSGVKEVEKGVIEAKKSEDSLKEIVQHIKIVTEEINQIAVSSEEQTQVTDEITKNIQQISTHVQEISIKTGENVETSQNLARISKDLQGLISYFKLEEADNSSSSLEDLMKKAKKIVDDAAQYLTRNGKEKAFKEFADPHGPFMDGDLYIFSNDLEGNMLFHAMDSSLVGKSHLDLKDVNGKFFVREFIDVAKTKGAGWVEYFWPHPITKTIQKKVAYIKRVEDLFLGCGIFV